MRVVSPTSYKTASIILTKNLETRTLHTVCLESYANPSHRGKSSGGVICVDAGCRGASGLGGEWVGLLNWKRMHSLFGQNRSRYVRVVVGSYVGKWGHVWVVGYDEWGDSEYWMNTALLLKTYVQSLGNLHPIVFKLWCGHIWGNRITWGWLGVSKVIVYTKLMYKVWVKSIQYWLGRLWHNRDHIIQVLNDAGRSPKTLPSEIHFLWYSSKRKKEKNNNNLRVQWERGAVELGSDKPAFQFWE